MTPVAARGLKHTCSACETRYFDLGRSPATCPKCQQVEAIVVKSTAVRRTRRTLGEGTPAATTGSILPGAKTKSSKPVKWKTGYSD